MNLSCLEINSTFDANFLDICLDKFFSVEAASIKELDSSITNSFDTFFNNEILFDGVVRSIRQYSDYNVDFIILSNRQTKMKNLVDSSIVVGKSDQQIHLLEFNEENLRKVLINA